MIPAQRPACRRFLDGGGKAQMDQFLDSVMPPEDEGPPLLHAAMCSVFSGGKRLRPLLCMASPRPWRCGRARPEDPTCSEPAVAMAGGAVELVHCYS